jgi:hypothetical protein
MDLIWLKPKSSKYEYFRLKPEVILYHDLCRHRLQYLHSQASIIKSYGFDLAKAAI